MEGEMRSEAEIHKRSRELRDAATDDCDCVECQVMLASHLALEWAIGNHEVASEQEKSLSRAAAKNRAERRKCK